MPTFINSNAACSTSTIGSGSVGDGSSADISAAIAAGDNATLSAANSYTAQEVEKLRILLMGGSVDAALDSFFDVQARLDNNDSTTQQILTALSGKVDRSVYDAFVVTVNDTLAGKAAAIHTHNAASVGAIPVSDKATQVEFDAGAIGKLPDCAMVKAAIASSGSSGTDTSYVDQEVTKLKDLLLGGSVDADSDSFFDVQQKLSEKLPATTFDDAVLTINQNIALKVDKTDFDSSLSDIATELDDKVDSMDFDSFALEVEKKQDTTDNSLATTSKTVVGSINELHSIIASLGDGGDVVIEPPISDIEISTEKAFSNQYVKDTYQTKSDDSLSGDDKSIVSSIEKLKTALSAIFNEDGKIKSELIDFIPVAPIREKIWSGLHVMEINSPLDVGVSISDVDGFFLQFQDMNNYPDNPSAANYNFSLHYCPTEFDGLMQMIYVPTYIVPTVSSGTQPSDVGKVLEFVISGSVITGANVSNVAGAGSDTCLTAVYINKRY